MAKEDFQAMIQYGYILGGIGSNLMGWNQEELMIHSI